MTQVERAAADHPVFAGTSTDHMLFEDASNPFRRDPSIPDAIWPDQQHRALVTNPQAVSFAAQDHPAWPVRSLQCQLSHSKFQSLPAGCAEGRITAFRLGGCCTEQQVVTDHAAMAVSGSRLVPRATCSRTAVRAH